MHCVVGDADYGCAVSLGHDRRCHLDVAVAVEDAIRGVDAPPKPVVGIIVLDGRRDDRHN